MQEAKAIPARPRKTLPKVESIDWQKVLVDQLVAATIKRLADEINEEEEMLLLH